MTQIYDPSSNLTQTHAAVYDTLNRLQQAIGGVNPGTEITQYSYDANNNLTSTIDPLGRRTTNAFDALNRLAQVTDPNNGQTRYGYSALDQLTGVADPRNVTTGYAVDALGNISQTQSPDAGTSQTVTDAAGNIIRRTDAKNQVTQYQYDALNRLSKETRADATVVTYTYDAGANQKGRLTGMTDPSGSTSWTYDLMGRVIQKNQTIDGTSRVTKYTYDAQGQLISLTYPSGKIINYIWTNGKITAVKLGTTNIASNIVYQPFGPVKSWTFQNGETVTRSFDLNGRMIQNNTGSISYDAAGRITSAYGRTYGYDNLDRLTSYQDGSTAYTYGLDANGNRTQQVVNSTINNYAIDFNSNKILSISAGTVTKTYGHDANGSITTDGTYTFTYDAAGRLVQAAQGTSVKGSYTFNGLGQRMKKVAGKTKTQFVYDETGHLLGEYNGTTLIQETVWFADMPIATIRGTTVYYVHTDHLNTPRKITDSTKKLRWVWDVPSFGATNPNENPAKGGTFQYNLRFPGQYADTETGLYYNYYRDYDPKTGRYIESDPIGLSGGLNSYSYVYGNPLSSTDPNGLWALNAMGGVAGMITGGVGGFISSGGKLDSALQGAAAGGLIGLLSPASALGTLLGGIASSATGQVLGNLSNRCVDDPLAIDWQMATIAGVGGLGGRVLAGNLTNAARSSSSYIISRGLGPASPVAKNGFSWFVEGSTGGWTEYGANAMRPSLNCGC